MSANEHDDDQPDKRLTPWTITESLGKYARTDELLALRARVAYDPPRKGDEEPFPGSPDDMMSTTATLRARVAQLEAVLIEVGDFLADDCVENYPFDRIPGSFADEADRLLKLDQGLRWGHTPMSERMWLAEQLEEARTQRDVLRVRVKELEEVIQTQNGVVVSGTLKLNEARARVAKLEAALRFLFEETKWNSVDIQRRPESLTGWGVTCYHLTFSAPPSRTRLNDASKMKMVRVGNGRIYEAPETWAEGEKMILDGLSYHEPSGGETSRASVDRRARRLRTSLQSGSDAGSDRRPSAPDVEDLPAQGGWT